MKPEKKLSYFLLLSIDKQEEFMREMRLRNEKLVDITAYCLMPNHIHLLLKQLLPNGISRFLANTQNSYTKYFNTKHDRTGPLFLDQFKAVRVESDEQLVHLTRCIHLNPITSYLIKDFSDLLSYPWSSLPEYITEEDICSTTIIMSSFKKKEAYLNFLEDQVDYQRTLKLIEHILHE